MAYCTLVPDKLKHLYERVAASYFFKKNWPFCTYLKDCLSNISLLYLLSLLIDDYHTEISII